MKRLFLPILFSVCASLPLVAAQQTPNPQDPPKKMRLWGCSLNFQGESEGILFTEFNFEGEGILTCRHLVTNPGRIRDIMYNPNDPATHFDSFDEVKSYMAELPSSYDGPGAEFEVPVKVTFQGPPILNVSLGKIAIKAYSKQWALVKDPELLIGEYSMVHAGASLGFGVGGFVGAHVAKEAYKLILAVELENGVGFHYGISKLKISPNL
jgi:hypothetical protein